MTTATTAFDVVIAGAGPAGAAAAISLLRQGASVLILDSAAGPKWKIGETLPPAAQPLLQQLGALSYRESGVHLPSYGNVSAWGSPELSSTDFIFNPHGHGWQLDRAVFERQLTEAAHSAGASLWYGATLLDVDQLARQIWKLAVRRNESLQCVRARYLIDATGRRSVVSHRLGARRKHLDALICIYMIAESGPGVSKDCDSRTLVEATVDGWWYSALMPTGRRIIAWLTDSNLMRGNVWRSCNWFKSQLSHTRHLRDLILRYGYAISGRPSCTSASSSRIEVFYGDGWLAVGDAAMAFDPLSSQGLFNALCTGAEGGVVVAKTLEGSTTAVEQYAAQLEASWNRYLENRLRYYRFETRWTNHSFWQSRR